MTNTLQSLYAGATGIRTAMALVAKGNKKRSPLLSTLSQVSVLPR